MPGVASTYARSTVTPWLLCSALDFETERVIQNNMRQICAGRTVIIIAHRLTAVRHADRIYAMDRGQLVEHGGHDDLIARGGYYAHLVSLQDAAS